MGFTQYLLKYSAYVGKIKVKGVLDYIALVPQGEVFDRENIKKCKVIAVGSSIDKDDVAMIQTISQSVPTSCSYVNIEDSMSIEDKDLKPGMKVFSIGFPYGHSLQKEMEQLRVICNTGTINQEPTEYGFMMNMPSGGGASGSPIFNDEGKLIGILNKGLGETFTSAVKAKYIKKLIDNPIKE